MKQPFRSFRHWILDSGLSLKDQVFVVLTMSAFLMVIAAVLGDLVYGENLLEIVVLTTTVLTIPVVTYLGISRKRVESASKIISLGIIFLILPSIFFFGGGPESGTVAWIIFCYLY